MTSSVGVVGKRNPPDISEVGEEDKRPELEAVEAEVSVRARVKRSEPAFAAAAISVLFSDCAAGSDRALSGRSNNRRLTGACAASFRTSVDFVDIDGRFD